VKQRYVALSAIYVAAVATSAMGQVVPCNFNLWDVCFLVGRGDRLTTVIPADFTITEIELQNGAHLTGYQGIGLADPDGSGGPVQLQAYESAGVSVRVYAGALRTQRGRYFSLHYGTRGNQIFGWFNTAEEQGSIVGFLKTFYACQRGQPNFASVVCTGDPVFSQGAEVISTLRLDPN
jgi:hypothetical protein